GTTGGAGSPRRAASRSRSAGSPVTTTSARAPISGWASALTVTSGPIPAGSPEETASRGLRSGTPRQRLQRLVDRLRGAERTGFKRHRQAGARATETGSDGHPRASLPEQLEALHVQPAEDPGRG